MCTLIEEEMEKTKILFVDDESNILFGLKRMLRSMHNVWEMRFIQDPHEAVQVAEQEHFDVVVTDMRMPEMDGAELLERISRISPSTVRIILSGYSDKQMSLSTVPVAHQFLVKPTSPERLFGVIESSLALSSILKSRPLLELVSRIKSLPALPDVYLRLVQRLGAEFATPEEIGGIISRDVGMSTKILQLVNSAFFGLVRRVDSLEQAVCLSGPGYCPRFGPGRAYL
ncbi:MAG: response regulator [Desulfonatronovibrionaceae bacterium]